MVMVTIGMMSSGSEAAGIVQQLTRLEDVIFTVERRLLQLLNERAIDALPQDDFETELGLLAKEIVRTFRRLVEVEERRDVGFVNWERMDKLDRHCVWLYKRIRLERAFFRKLHLEKKLEELASAEAFAVYRTILEVDESEEEVRALAEAAIRTRLLESEQPT
jgi:hypothetical protein